MIFTAGLYSCEKDNPNEVNNDALYESILKQYVNTTVIPTYKALAEAALEMRAANEALKATPSDATMEAASQAWMKARICWELSEGFLFGPVSEDAFNVDAHIDSWPLDLPSIQQSILDQNGDITGREAWNMDEGVIGFHTAEYLLYRDGQSRPIADLSYAELKYLTAVTDALVWDCVLIYISWAGLNNVSAEIRAVFNENPDIVTFYNELPNYHNFGEKLTSKTDYPSWAAALAEISEGALTIAEEVGATKIESPYVSRSTHDVESWYSWHSIDDYKNNIISIKNAYIGGVSDATRTSVSLSNYIKTVNGRLDADIKAKIEDCIAKIEAMGTGGLSFYEVVRDQVNRTQVEAAVDACLDLKALFATVSDSIE